jgi:hypothetical protein
MRRRTRHRRLRLRWDRIGPLILFPLAFWGAVAGIIALA